MAALDHGIVHRAKGRVLLAGRDIGVIDVADFVFEPVGVGAPERLNRDTCYGTVSGCLSDTSVIISFNAEEPDTVSLALAVEGGGVINVVLDGVHFIDDIHSSGEMSDVEFSGTVSSVD